LQELKAQTSELKEKTAALQSTEAQLQEILQEKTLSEEARQKTEESLESVRKQLRTKDEQAKIEKKAIEEQLTAQIQDWKSKYESIEVEYRNERIRRSLQDAAGSEVFSLEGFVDYLAPRAKIIEESGDDGKPTSKIVVDIKDEDSDGKEFTSAYTPAEAVKRMKELPTRYGYFFKSNIVSGVGGSNNSNPAIGGNGQVDMAKLAKNPVEYRRLRKERPELFPSHR
jgi:hypothetical protein